MSGEKQATDPFEKQGTEKVSFRVWGRAPGMNHPLCQCSIGCVQTAC